MPHSPAFISLMRGLAALLFSPTAIAPPERAQRYLYALGEGSLSPEDLAVLWVCLHADEWKRRSGEAIPETPASPVVRLFEPMMQRLKGIQAGQQQQASGLALLCLASSRTGLTIALRYTGTPSFDHLVTQEKTATEPRAVLYISAHIACSLLDVHTFKLFLPGACPRSGLYKPLLPPQWSPGMVGAHLRLLLID